MTQASRHLLAFTLLVLCGHARAQHAPAPQAAPAPPPPTQSTPPQTQPYAPTSAPSAPTLGSPAAVTPPPQQHVAAPRIAIFDVLPLGADPRLAADLTRALRAAATRLGYAPVDEATLRVHPAVAAGQGITPALAARIVRDFRADRGVFASVGVEPGRYKLRLFATTAEGDSEDRSEAALPADVFRVAERLLGELIPEAEPPEILDPTQPPYSGPSLRLAAGTEGAIGLSGAGFYNHMLHARFDLAFSSTTAAGFELAYTNLKGRDGRAHNVLPSVVLEHAIELGSGWSIPVSFAPGYLPKNGPVLQATGGVAYAFDDTTELALTLLAPTAWITKDETVYSLNLGAELRFGM